MPPLLIKAVITEVVSEIASALAITAYTQQKFIGFKTEDANGIWVDEMTEWMLTALEFFNADDDSVETALDEIRKLVYQLFENPLKLVEHPANPK